MSCSSSLQAWEKQREAQIREATVKNLEPEIQALLDKHRGDLQRLREEHVRALDDVRLEVEAQFADRLAATDRRVSEAVEAERQRGLVRERSLQEAHDRALAQARLAHVEEM
jgi:5-azacytidine-induced protein 1